MEGLPTFSRWLLRMGPNKYWILASWSKKTSHQKSNFGYYHPRLNVRRFFISESATFLCSSLAPICTFA